MSYKGRSEILNEVFKVSTTAELIEQIEMLITVNPIDALGKIRSAMQKYGEGMARHTKDLYHDKN